MQVCHFLDTLMFTYLTPFYFSGGSSGSLHDIKLPDSAGGYTYKDSGRLGSPARNRFIYWYFLKYFLIPIQVNSWTIMMIIKFYNSRISQTVTIASADYNTDVILLSTYVKGLRHFYKQVL